VLEKDVMIFVNEISKVVHKEVDLFLGAANKNIGDAFLLTWKIPFDEVNYNELTNDLELMDTIGVTQ